MPRSTTEVPVLHSLKIGLSAFIFVLPLLTGCSETEKPIAEAPPSPVAVQAEQSQQQQPQQILKLPPPQMNEVQEAVKRVFKDAVLVDNNHKPTFIVGDFNGDLSQDLAVVLKPASHKLSELNEEMPIWMLRDLAESSQPGIPRLRVTANDELLAIIHGHEANGWRDHQATQTFLLKNATGSGMETHSAKDFLAAHQGSQLPRLRGDVVGEERGGKSGYVYYAGGTYAWYDPKTFKGEPERQAGHLGSRATKK